MASALSHVLVALAIGQLHPWKMKPIRFWGMSCLRAVLPDCDVVGFAMDIPYDHLLGRRRLTHSLFFAVLVGFLVVRVTFPEIYPWSRGWGWLVLHFSLVTASHGVLDAITDGGLGVAFFAPFENGRYFLPWTPIKVSPIGITGVFSHYGLEVLANEAMWIGFPIGIWLIGVAVYQRKR